MSSAIPSARCIALLTDFGTLDWYVAAMKGRILRICPDVQLVDIAHEIRPQDVEGASFVLQNCLGHFPDGTVFLCVVDPGVGSLREPVIVKTDHSFFVGPNNGLFGLLEAQPHETRVISVPAGVELSATFHGRDLFAPTAARLTLGEEWHQLTSRSTRLVPLESDACPHVVWFDRYGNAVTNVHHGHASDASVCIVPRLGLHLPIVRTYSDVMPGQPLAYWGSSRFLEIGVRDGSAQRELSLEPGEPVQVTATD